MNDKPDIPNSWRDPSGWRPTELQMSIPPEAKGKPWHVWMYKQSVCDVVKPPAKKSVLPNVGWLSGQDES